MKFFQTLGILINFFFPASNRHRLNDKTCEDDIVCKMTVG